LTDYLASQEGLCSMELVSQSVGQSISQPASQPLIHVPASLCPIAC